MMQSVKLFHDIHRINECWRDKQEIIGMLSKINKRVLHLLLKWNIFYEHPQIAHRVYVSRNNQNNPYLSYRSMKNSEHQITITL